MSDIVVHIGASYCRVTLLTMNALTCLPPKDRPRPSKHPGPSDTRRVTVSFGDINFENIFGISQTNIHRGYVWNIYVSTKLKELIPYRFLYNS